MTPTRPAFWCLGLDPYGQGAACLLFRGPEGSYGCAQACRLYTPGSGLRWAASAQYHLTEMRWRVVREFLGRKARGSVLMLKRPAGSVSPAREGLARQRALDLAAGLEEADLGPATEVRLEAIPEPDVPLRVDDQDLSAVISLSLYGIKLLLPDDAL